MAAPLVFDILAKILAIYAVVLIIAAIVLNPLVVYVCFKSKKLRYTSTFKLLAFASINDLFTCLVWNEGDFAHTFFGRTLSKHSPFYCRVISVFFQYTTLQIASWMITSICLDRLLSMLVNGWNRRYFNGGRPFIYSIILSFIIIGINFNEIFTVGYSHVKNGTQIFVCYSNAPNTTPWYDIMSLVLVYFGEFVPFGLMITLNLGIIYKATQFSRAQSTISSSYARVSKRKAQMSRMIFSITFLYILVSTPSTIISGYFYPTVAVLPEGKFIVNLINAFQFSFHAFNFFILCFSNKLFAREARIALFRPLRGNLTLSNSSNLQNN